MYLLFKRECLHVVTTNSLYLKKYANHSWAKGEGTTLAFEIITTVFKIDIKLTGDIRSYRETLHWHAQRVRAISSKPDQTARFSDSRKSGPNVSQAYVWPAVTEIRILTDPHNKWGVKLNY